MYAEKYAKKIKHLRNKQIAEKKRIFITYKRPFT